MLSHSGLPVIRAAGSIRRYFLQQTDFSYACVPDSLELAFSQPELLILTQMTHIILFLTYMRRHWTIVCQSVSENLGLCWLWTIERNLVLLASGIISF